MKRTFKITIVITTDSEKSIKDLMEVKNQILSGKMQREMEDPKNRVKYDKVAATFEEITKS